MRSVKRSMKTMNVGMHVLVLVICILGALNSAWAQGTRGRAPDRAQTAAQNNEGAPAQPLPPTASIIPGSGANMQEYVLGVGDKIKLIVYGEDDLSGEYEINSTGVVALPLIGNIPAAQKTVKGFEEAVKEKLSQGYLQNPRVSVQVANYRPFFILGEVSKPGSYPYVNGMNVLNAIAMAGGYTYRANESGIVVVHAHDPAKKEVPIKDSESIMPGDIIRVPERFF